MDIRLPANFTAAHRAAVLRFVQGKPMDDAQYAMQLEAFDLLHRATVGDDTFAAFHERVVEEPAADPFIAALLDAPDPQIAAPTLLVFLKRPAWDAIDGKTLPTTLTALLDVLPIVAEIKHGGQALVVVEYEEWKTRVLKRQRGEEKQE